MSDPISSIRESLSRLSDEPAPPVYAPVSLKRCSYCEKPSDELVTYVDGVAICLTCRQREQERMNEELYREQYGPDYDKLATYNAEGR